jgi:hypothetical protein
MQGKVSKFIAFDWQHAKHPSCPHEIVSVHVLGTPDQAGPPS